MSRKLFTVAVALLITGGTATMVFAKASGGSADGLSAAIAQYGCPAGTSGVRCVSDHPTIAVAGMRRACMTRSVKLRMKIASSAALSRVTVFLDRKRILSTTKASFTLRIRTNRLSPGRHRLRTVAVDAAGHRTTMIRTIARCAKLKPRHRAAPRFTG
jgi:hypothetical protein